MTKRRKRELEGTLEVEGYPLRWTLRSEQIWDAHGDHLGLRLSVECLLLPQYPAALLDEEV